jgi:hypothetical protein
MLRDRNSNPGGGVAQSVPDTAPDAVGSLPDRLRPMEKIWPQPSSISTHVQRASYSMRS